MLTAAGARELKARLTATATATANRKRKPTHDFPTAPDLAREVVQTVEIVDGNWVPEPSCGDGNLIRALLAEVDARNADQPDGDAMRIHIEAVEIDSLNALIASDIRHPYATLQVHHADFLKWLAPRTYQRIVMNPPFNGAECVKHFEKAVSLLSKPFGKIACILPRAQLTNTRLRALICAWSHEVWELPPDQFMTSGANKIETICVSMSVGDAYSLHQPHAAYADPGFTTALHHVLITEASNQDLYRGRQMLVKNLREQLPESRLAHARRHLRWLEIEITRRCLEVWHLNDAEVETYMSYVLDRDNGDLDMLDELNSLPTMFERTQVVSHDAP